MPGGERRRGQRRRLPGRDRIGQHDQRGGGHDDLFGQPAIMGDAIITAERRRRKIAVEPGDEMRRDNPVARLHARHPGPDRNHLANAFRHRHAAGRPQRAVAAFEHQHVAVIEADFEHLDDRFARPGDGIGARHGSQAVQTRLRADFIRFHGIIGALWSVQFCQSRVMKRSSIKVRWKQMPSRNHCQVRARFWRSSLFWIIS